MRELGTPLVNGENQSRPDTMMPPRFLQYGADNMTPHLREDKEVSLLIQLLVYNEKLAPYPYHSTLQACYKRPEWGSQELALCFCLVDLTQISDQELLQRGHCVLMKPLLKHGRGGNFELAPNAYREVSQACVAVVGSAIRLDNALAMLPPSATRW